MRIWQKIKNRFRRKDSLTASIITAPGFGGTIWTPKGYDNFAKETYLKNVTAFTAIREVSQSVASVPWGQFQRLPDGGREKVEEGPVVDVLKRPNPSESLPFVMLRGTAFLVMSGNSFLERIVLDTGPNKGDIQELYALRPDRFKMKVDPNTRQLGGYEYTVQGRKVEWEVDPVTGQCDVLHLKSFHPLDDFWGAAATESAAREIDTSNAATQWNKSLLDRQGRPGMVFSLIGALGAEQFDALEQVLRDRSGPEHAGKDIIITGEKGTTVKPYGWNPTDMDFDKGDQRLMRKISMGYGVPPELLGIQDATFSNRAEARLFFWENTVFWYLNYFRGELNNWLFEEDSDMFIDYILDDVPALAIKRDMVWKRAQEADFLKINEKREMVGLEDIGVEGDVILISATMIPLGTSGEEEEAEKEEEEKARQELKDQGYSEDEIDEMLGLTHGAATKGDEMSRQDWLDIWKTDPHFATSMKPSPLAKELVSMEAENDTKGRILEIGCGNGRDSIYFGKQGHSVIGIDISSVAVRIAKGNNALENVQFEVGDAEKLRFEAGSFDAIYSLSVLQTTKLEKSVVEVSRVLKKKGIALLYLYVKTTFFDEDDKEKGRTVVNFKVDEMDKLLKGNRLQVLDKYRDETEDEDENGTHVHTIIVYFLRKK